MLLGYRSVSVIRGVRNLWILVVLNNGDMDTRGEMNRVNLRCSFLSFVDVL